jgi:hypothetical protein
MTKQPVAKVHSEQRRCFCSERIFIHTHAEAAYPADHDCKNERRSEQVAGRLLFPDKLFGKFNTNKTAKEPSNNRRILIEMKENIRRFEHALRIFETAQQPAANDCSEDGPNDNPQSICGNDRIVLFCSQVQKIPEPQEYPGSLKYYVIWYVGDTDMQLPGKGQNVEV